MQSFAGRWNVDLIDQMHTQWRQDPQQVGESWRLFFEGFELGQNRTGPVADDDHDLELARKQLGIYRLIDAYRRHGHVLAHVDPLADPGDSHPLLDLSRFGLSEADLKTVFFTSPFVGMEKATLGDLLYALRSTYCRTIGVEFMHIQDPEICNWLRDQMEPRHNQPELSHRHKLRILVDLQHAEVFEKFLHTRFLGQKRFSLEGAETLIPLLNLLAEQAADTGCRELVLGMAHRGRLNVLANVLEKPYKYIFSEFEDNYLPNSAAGDGDVKYHLGFSCDRVTAKGASIHLTLTPNPSHLEAVNPVVQGRARAKQHRLGDASRTQVMPILIHGDAAFAGQGLVTETLNLSQLQGYKTGGTIHIIINNQIGFTTKPSDARSTRYATDVAKMIEVPIFHVNSEDPEAVIFVTEIALAFRQKFHRDVVIDLNCYRKHGHNEGDEPSYTSPVMVGKIEKKPSLSRIYADSLIKRGLLTEEENQSLADDFLASLNKEQEEMKAEPHFVRPTDHQGTWSTISSEYNGEAPPTGVAVGTLEKIATVLATYPANFEPHDKMKPLIEARRNDVVSKKPIAWGLGEALAFGSLVLEGFQVRVSGQDSRRGTFSQRHAVLYDKRDERAYIPLQHLAPHQAKFSAYDSLLSEAAVLGYEFGYSLDSPRALVMWEAQFGDFVNGAQVIIDQYIASSKSKWQRDSGVVLLLPHGYEGQGPEHSSARLERFLQLCAEDNMQVCYPTTPAQYFHLLRRQMHQSFRRPLIVMTPKSLLRHKGAVSLVDEFTEGSFRNVVDDPLADRQRVRRIVLCSGKLYYDLQELRSKEPSQVAIVRLEQLYPFPKEQLQRVLHRYPLASEDVVWAQEESQNMGAWFFVEPRLRDLGIDVKYVGRDASASPATGSKKIHDREQKELVRAALQGKTPHVVSAYDPNRFFSDRVETNGSAKEHAEAERKNDA